MDVAEIQLEESLGSERSTLSAIRLGVMFAAKTGAQQEYMLAKAAMSRDRSDAFSMPSLVRERANAVAVCARFSFSFIRRCRNARASVKSCWHKRPRRSFLQNKSARSMNVR